MEIKAAVEYNEGGVLVYAVNFPGAFARGKTRQAALDKLPHEVEIYSKWLGNRDRPSLEYSVAVVQEKYSTLQICDADSEVLFDSERMPLTREAYDELKALALKSAADFQLLYDSIPNKKDTTLLPRKTFYGEIPLTAEAMYAHTKSVNAYYFGEIGVNATNLPDIAACRQAGFAAVEEQGNYLANRVSQGSYGEEWTLGKVLRRFIWHDRIHAKAMYRMAVRLGGKMGLTNPFWF